MSFEIRGLIWSIQRFNIQDGSGIRTLVFFKGCPLMCLWCSNPEGQSRKPEILVYRDQCRQSGFCLPACTVGAIQFVSGYPEINKNFCTGCGDCVSLCPESALALVGESFTVNQVIEIVRKDESFYRKSGGGLTLSGGEPLLQADFASDLLRAAKDYYINTAIETCGCVPWAEFIKVIPYTDTILFDIKNLDPLSHRLQTGVTNELILRNLTHLSEIKELTIILRTPLIPGENDSPGHLHAIADLAARLNVKRWDILPYHRYGEWKYLGLGRNYSLGSIVPQEDSHLQDIVERIKKVFPNINLNS